HSRDGGLSFEPGIAIAKNNLFLNPSLALTDGGSLELLYYEGPLGDQNRALLTVAHAPDGMTFRCGRIADVGAFPHDPRHFGDYTGLAAGGGHLYAVFGEDLGHSQISFARIDAP